MNHGSTEKTEGTEKTETVGPQRAAAMIYKHIHFKIVEEKPATKVWECRVNSSGFILGTIRWRSLWRQYCFMPGRSTVFNKDRMNDISDFIDKQMAERKTA